MAGGKDHPDVIAFPPLIFLAVLILTWGLGKLIPLGILPPSLSTWALIPGVAISGVAATVALSGILAFRRAGTHVEPHKPALVLVEDGPYRFTRNPMYVGLVTLLIGVSLIFSLDWGLVTWALLWQVLHHGVVLREEAYLADKFGEPYLAFLNRTRRWI